MHERNRRPFIFSQSVFLIKVYKKSSSHFFQIRAFWQSSTKGLSCPDRLDENPDRMDFFGPEYSDLIFGPVLTFVRIFEKKKILTTDLTKKISPNEVRRICLNFWFSKFKNRHRKLSKFNIFHLVFTWNTTYNIVIITLKRNIQEDKSDMNNGKVKFHLAKTSKFHWKSPRSRLRKQ